MSPAACLLLLCRSLTVGGLFHEGCVLLAMIIHSTFRFVASDCWVLDEEKINVSMFNSPLPRPAVGPTVRNSVAATSYARCSLHHILVHVCMQRGRSGDPDMRTCAHAWGVMPSWCRVSEGPAAHERGSHTRAPLPVGSVPRGHPQQG